MAYTDGNLWPTWYSPTSRIPADELIAKLSRRFGVEREMVLGTCRQRQFLGPRVVAIKILRERGHSYPTIGRLLCRDHSTIVYHADRFKGYENHIPGVREAYLEFRDA